MIGGLLKAGNEQLAENSLERETAGAKE